MFARNDNKPSPTSLALRMCWLLLAVLALTPAAFAQQKSIEQQGWEVANEVYQRSRGFGDSRVRMDMVLLDRRGTETRRQLEVWTLEGPSGEDKSLIYFHSPRDIRGTALLTYSHSKADDDQWLYLPALRRTKRISTSGRSSPFMGSEFAYEDLAATHVDDFSYRFLRNDKLRGTDCFVIERYPKYSGSNYTRQQVWIERAEYRVLQVEYWDRKDRRLKTLSLGGYKKYLDKLWQPAQARMENHRTRETTFLRWHDYQFRTGLKEDDFRRDALQRTR